MKSNPAEDARQITEYISKHPIKGYFMVHDNMVQRMNMNASLLLQSVRAFVVAVGGIFLGVGVFVVHGVMMAVTPFTKLWWYVGILRKIRNGEHLDFKVFEDGDNDED